MKSCRIIPHHAGIFSLINKVVTCLHVYDRVEVDFSQGCAYGKPEDGNIWNHLFEPTPKVDAPHDLIESYPTQWLTYKNAGYLYATDRPWREECNRYWNQLMVRESILEDASDFVVKRDLQDFISVMVRCHHHAGEQTSGKSQRLDEYAAAIERASGPATTIFLMAGDYETVEWFKARFSVDYFEDTPRTPTRDTDLMAMQSTVADARRCLTEVLVASNARALIHPVSNMSTACLYIDPEMQSIYLP